MKKCLLFLLFLELFATAISQEKSVYIWDNGKRVSLLEDTTSFVFYSKDNRVLDNSISRYVQKTLRTKHSESYHIVKKTNTLFFQQIRNSSDIIGSHYAYTVGLDTLYLTYNIVLKKRREIAMDDILSTLESSDIDEVEEVYGLFFIRMTNLNKVVSAANTIYESGLVEWCRPSFIRKIERCSENKDKQYYLHNVLHGYDAFGKDINALKAWMITKGCRDIRVAVLDDGAEDHHELRDENGLSRVLLGYSVPGEPPFGHPNDTSKHGQCCAGIIAASHSSEMRGIAPKVSIVPVNLGFGDIDEQEIFEAINWAWDPAGGNADVLSCSWACHPNSVGSSLYIEAIHNAQIYGRGGDLYSEEPGLGSVVVFSSGNDGLDRINPYAREAIAVGALDKNDELAKYDSGIRYTNIGEGLDLMAYGGTVYTSLGSIGDIRTIDREGSLGYSQLDYYDGFNATSAACPMVSGAAALILSINPFLKRTEVEEILFSTAKDLGTQGWDQYYGYGKLDVFSACSAALRTIGEEFYAEEDCLHGTQIMSNNLRMFTSSPGINVVAGSYFCDVYKFESTVSDDFLYVGDGLSLANPNDGSYYVNYTEIDDSTKITTYFYHILTNTLGQNVDKWIPYNPYYNSTYVGIMKKPSSIQIFNEIINEDVTKTLYATDMIVLTDGFWAKNGSDFTARIVSPFNTLACVPNPSAGVFQDDDFSEKKAREESIKDNDNDFLLPSPVSENEICHIFPNPSNGMFTVLLTDMCNNVTNIDIYSLSGVLLSSEGVKDNKRHFQFVLKSGVYFIRIVSNRDCVTKKIIIR